MKATMPLAMPSACSTYKIRFAVVASSVGWLIKATSTNAEGISVFLKTDKLDSFTPAVNS
jgi:hypothetical protein